MPDEWARAETYLGLFERINRLIETGNLSAEYVARFYGYRINNIWANDIIRQESWKLRLLLAGLY